MRQDLLRKLKNIAIERGIIKPEMLLFFFYPWSSLNLYSSVLKQVFQMRYFSMFLPLVSLMLAACVTENHYHDKDGIPLQQYEHIYASVQRFFPNVDVPSIKLIFNDKAKISQFDPQNNSIYISSTNNLGNETIAHETSHLFLNVLTHGASVKDEYRFIDAGYATFVRVLSQDQTEELALKKRAISITKARIEKNRVSFNLVQKWSTYFVKTFDWDAYMVGLSFVFYVKETYGDELFMQLLQTLGTVPDLNSAFLIHFHKGNAEIEQEWIRYVNETFFLICGH